MKIKTEKTVKIMKTQNNGKCKYMSKKNENINGMEAKVLTNMEIWRYEKGSKNKSIDLSVGSEK